MPCEFLGRVTEKKDVNAALQSPTLQALLLLTAIPAVGYLLFADYQGRALDRLLLLRELQKGDRALIELQKVRLVSMVGLVFQLALFFGSGAVRAQSPLLVTIAFAAAVLVQGLSQGKLESKIRLPVMGPPVPGSGKFMDGPRQTLLLAVRSVAMLVLGGAIYLGCVLGCLKGAALLFGREMPAVFFIAGWVGILAGLAVNFALTRWYLRWTLPVVRLGRDLPEWELLRAAYQAAGLDTPAAYLWRDALWSPSTVLVTGFSRLRFSSAVFVSPKVLAALTPQELHAVFCHEAAHQRSRHLERRLGLALGMIFFSTVCVSLFMVLGFMAMQQSGRAGESPAGLGGILAMVAFVITFRSLARQSQVHELNADRAAVLDLGADAEALIGALVKLDRLRRGEDADPTGTRVGAADLGLSTGRFAAQNRRVLASHPELALRIQLLRKLAERPSASRDAGAAASDRRAA